MNEMMSPVADVIQRLNAFSVKEKQQVYEHLHKDLHGTAQEPGEPEFSPTMMKKPSAACSTAAQFSQAASFNVAESSLEYDASLIYMEGYKLMQREGDEPDTLHVLITTGELMEFKCSRADKITGMVDLNSEADTYPLHRMQVRMTATAVDTEMESAMSDGELVSIQYACDVPYHQWLDLKKRAMLVTDSEVEEEAPVMDTQPQTFSSTMFADEEMVCRQQVADSLDPESAP